MQLFIDDNQGYMSIKLIKSVMLILLIFMETFIIDVARYLAGHDCFAYSGARSAYHFHDFWCEWLTIGWSRWYSCKCVLSLSLHVLNVSILHLVIFTWDERIFWRFIFLTVAISTIPNTSRTCLCSMSHPQPKCSFCWLLQGFPTASKGTKA